MQAVEGIHYIGHIRRATHNVDLNAAIIGTCTHAQLFHNIYLVIPSHILTTISAVNSNYGHPGYGSGITFYDSSALRHPSCSFTLVHNILFSRL